MSYSQHMQPARKQIVSRYRCAFVVFLLCALFTACGLLDAQTGGTGAISGTITDPAGAVVVGAQVKVTGAGTGYTRTSQTNASGLYLMSLLPPGQYTLEVTKQGFKVAVSPDVQVIVAETTVQNMPLQTGEVTETVTVASVSVELQTESSELGRVTDSEMVASLPLVARNFTQIIGLNAGVAQEVNNAGNNGRGGGGLSGVPGGGSLMTQGGTAADNNFEMNGLPINDVQGSMTYSMGIPVANPDTIQEFKVQTALYDATTGRNGGADVDVITKGGTNGIHATMFEFLRNEDLNANDWFAKKAGQPRDVLRQNQYGFTASGPLVKDKLLLFGSWQGTKQFNALDQSDHHDDLLPPLTNDRSYTGLGSTFGGDSGYLVAYAGPSQTILSNGSNIAPQAYNLLNAKLPNGQYVIPTPQKCSPSVDIETECYSHLSAPGFFDENQWMVNGDYLRSDRNKVAVRYFGALSNISSTMDGSSTLGFAVYQPERFDVGSIGDTYTLSPSLVNQLVVGFRRSTSAQHYDDAFSFQSLGMNALPEQEEFPLIDIADDGFIVGTSSATAFLEAEYQIADTLSWTKGKHQLTFGGGFDYGKDHMQYFDYPGDVIPLTWADFLLGQPEVAYGYGNIYESFEGLGNKDRDWRYKSANGFIQDDYVIARRFTLNLGLRYERIGDFGEASGKVGNVDVSALNPNPGAAGSYAGYLIGSNYRGPAAPPGVIQGSNTMGFNGDGQNVLNPRVGFAWMLPGSERFVLRGGIGMYHSTTTGQMNLQMSAEEPYGSWSNLVAAADGAQSDANPFPTLAPLPSWSAYSDTTAYTMDALAMNWRPPTTYHYSLGLQSKLPGGAVLDAAYSGARSLHIIAGSTINQAALASASAPIRGQTTNTLANLTLRAPYMGWATDSMYYFSPTQEAWYSSLQATLTQKFRHSFQYQAAYTWARLLSPVPGFTVGTNVLGPSGDQTVQRAHESGYGPDPWMRPQRFVLSAYYVLPSPAKSHHVLADTLGGWNVATATVVQSGQEVSLSYNNANNIYGVNNDRPSYATGCTAKSLPTSGSVSSRVNNYINAACLTTPAVIGDDGVGMGFGNTPNGILKGPGQADVDLSLSKNLPVHWPKSDASVLLRADFFNTLNHPNFAVPDTAYAPGSTAFGTILSTTTNPRVTQFALKYSF
ncbi:MAG: carboxypeptidase regulatory-like domain-containing protein [Terracidiphilus sp.]